MASYVALGRGKINLYPRGGVGHLPIPGSCDDHETTFSARENSEKWRWRVAVPAI